MIAKYDDFNHFCQPVLTLTNPEGNALGICDENYIKNFIFTPRFNDVSEISFDFYENDSPAYRKIKPRMRISVEDYGSFIISTVHEYTSAGDSLNYKSVTLKSTEEELSDIQLPYLDGTYIFYDISNPDRSLLGMIMSKIPLWSISHIDSSVAGLYRTFEIPEGNILDFLLNTVQTAYGCLFEFDCQNRKISVHNQETYIHYTNILLTYDELLESLETESSLETFTTALTVYGSGDLSINAVNPLGTSTIYDFSMVKSWMSKELLDRVNAWEQLIHSNIPRLRELNLNISNIYSELTSCETELETWNTKLKGYTAERDALIAKGADLTGINADISEANAAILSAKEQLEAKEALRDDLTGSRALMQNEVDPANYFGELYPAFLSYVFEKEYTQENIGVTDTMSYEERLIEMNTLYNNARECLNAYVNISETYSIDPKSFIFNKSFADCTRSLVCGHLIGVEKEGSIIYFPIMEFKVDYDSQSIDITLGSRFNSSRARDMFSDLMHNISSANKAVDYLSSKKADSDEVTDLRKFINSSLDLSKNRILSADGQTVEITDSGYHGRRIDENGNLDTREVALINNTLAFTKDNWNSCNLALGEIQVGDHSVYGLIADTVVGKMTLSENLYVSNSSGTYTIDGDGLTAANPANNCQISIKPNDADNLFSISSGNSKKFYVDSSGNVVFSGTLSGAEGIFSGTLTAGSINADNVKFGDLTINDVLVKKASVEELNAVNVKVDTLSSNVIKANEAIIENINAAEARIGTIESNYIKSDEISTIQLDAGQITTGKLSADRIDVNSLTVDAANITGTLQVLNLQTSDNSTASYRPVWMSPYFFIEYPALEVLRDPDTNFVTDVKIITPAIQVHTLVGLNN